MLNFGLSGSYGLENHGLYNLKAVYWNLVPAELVEHAVARQEGQMVISGALSVNTGKHTGRSPADKFLAQTTSLADEAIWWGKINQPLPPEKFQLIFQKCAPTCKEEKFSCRMFRWAHTHLTVRPYAS